jgi:tRNA(Ser,Leu) C12 N-acetylase TAN1
VAKISVDLGETPSASSEATKLKELAKPLPSVSKAKAGAIKTAPRVQFSFTNVPKPIKDAFAAEAKRRNLTQKAFLYECLRAGGLEIPDMEDIDGRTR